MRGGVSDRMSRTRRRDTTPEMAVRRLLHAAGYRYRVDHRPIPTLRRTGDIVFPRKKLVVLIDGCFWHGCPEHFVIPKTRTEWWLAKIGANQRRDLETERLWTDAGWNVLRFWEHEDPQCVAAVVAQALDSPTQKRVAG